MTRFALLIIGYTAIYFYYGIGWLDKPGFYRKALYGGLLLAPISLIGWSVLGIGLQEIIVYVIAGYALGALVRVMRR